MLFTNSDVSHSAMYIEIWEKGYVLEAQRKGVVLLPFEKWEKIGYRYTTSIPIGIDDKFLAIKSMSKLGTAYDYISLLFYKPLEMFFSVYIKRKDYESKLYCSELISLLFNINGFEGMTPRDLKTYCLTNTDKFTTL